jgi:hypothetical protein
MTTNLNAWRLEALNEDLAEWETFYEDPADIKQRTMFISAQAAIRELLALREASKQPVASFYRDGIAAAANWVEQQRESYDNEHGRHDPDTGTFEFGNDAQSEYSSTLAEIAEGIRALQPNAAPQPAVVPDGYTLVPIEATEDMVIAGFESEPDKFFSEPDKWEAYEALSGCQQAAHKANLCWAAMIAAAPKAHK